MKTIEDVRNEPCLACGMSPPSDPAHVISRGAGGSDEVFNLIPLCRICHSLQHNQGWGRFFKRYPLVYFELRTRGFEFDEFDHPIYAR